MIYRIYAQKDSTIYEPSQRKVQNTGGDQILEISKIFDEETNSVWLGNSRVLIKFDLSSVSQSIANNEISNTNKFYINLTSAEEKEIKSEYDLTVYQISSSWDGGVGQYYHNPVDTDGVSWEYKSKNERWGVSSATIFNDSVIANIPTDGIILYDDFTDNNTSAYLTESINDIAGNEPFTYIDNDKLIVSASNYAGTTLVFPVELDESAAYGVQFQIDPGAFNSVQFRVEDVNGVIKAEESYDNFVGNITSPSTQSFELTSTDAGDYKLLFTFFDTNDVEANISTGSFDELYVWQKLGKSVAWETFALNAGNFKLKNVIKNTNAELPRMFASESKLNLYSDNFGGGDATHTQYLSSDLEYTVSSEIELGNYPKIEFTLYDTNGLKLRSGIENLTSSFTESATQSITFTPTKSGNYTFAYTFFDTGSLGASGSLDNFKIIYSGSVETPPITAAGYYKNLGGGTWYTSSMNNTTYSQRFTKYNRDLNLEVTEYVKDWLSGARVNDGFMIKRPASQESGSVAYGSSKFFSSETNTIYVPTLDVRWDDSVFETGSLNPLTSTNITIYPKNLQSEYKETSKARIRIVGRERYPQRTFSDSSLITDVKYLPQTTYYQIRDVETNLVILPFDTNHTKVSCDSTGNYFDIWFNTLQPERFYQFEFRVDRAGTQEYFDGYVFKVVR
jgi:hypothetical protein